MSDSLTTFDYRLLDHETQIVVQERTAEIKGKMRDVGAGILQIGEAVADVQQRLAKPYRGGFLLWIKQEFGWEKSTAYNFIHVYQRFGSLPNFGTLDIATSALYHAAARSTPESAVDEILQRAEAGEEITHALAQEIIARHKPAPTTAADIDQFIESAPHAPLETEVSQVGLIAQRGATHYDDTPAERALRALASIYDLHQRGNQWIDPGQLERTLRGTLPVLAQSGALARQQQQGRNGLETQYQIAPFGCQQLGKPFIDALTVENDGVDRAYNPADPAQNPIAETHPHWAASPHPAICPTCGTAHSQWKPLPGAYWRCRICEHNGVVTEIRDDAMEVETPEDRAAQERMAKRRTKGSASILHSSESNDWYTPKAYIEAARAVMGRIDLDPASCALANAVVQASIFYTAEDDGISKLWHGSIWLNPPYGRGDGNESNQSRWSSRLIDAWQDEEIDQAILLCNAATASQWFKPLWNFPICFTYERIKFYNEDGQQENPTHDNCFVYFGSEPERFYDYFEPFGQIVIPQRTVMPQGVVSVALTQLRGGGR